VPLSAAILVCSLKKKSRKRLACDVLHTFTTNAGIVYDLSFEKEEQKKAGLWCTSYKCWHFLWHHWYRQLSAQWQCSQWCFCNFQMTVCTEQDRKLSEKQLCVYFLFCSNPEGLHCFFGLVPLYSSIFDLPYKWSLPITTTKYIHTMNMKFANNNPVLKMQFTNDITIKLYLCKSQPYEEAERVFSAYPESEMKSWPS